MSCFTEHLWSVPVGNSPSRPVLEKLMMLLSSCATPLLPQLLQPLCSSSTATTKQCSPILVSASVPCTAAQDLSGAYTNLEAHCYQVEAEVRRLKEQLAQASAQASAQAAAEQPGEWAGRVCWQRHLCANPLHTMSQPYIGHQWDYLPRRHPEYGPSYVQFLGGHAPLAKLRVQ